MVLHHRRLNRIASTLSLLAASLAENDGVITDPQELNLLARDLSEVQDELDRFADGVTKLCRSYAPVLLRVRIHGGRSPIVTPIPTRPSLPSASSECLRRMGLTPSGDTGSQALDNVIDTIVAGLRDASASGND